RRKLIVAVLGVVLGLAGLGQPAVSTAAQTAPTGDNICVVNPLGNPVDGCASILPWHIGPPNPCHCDYAVIIGVPGKTPPATVDRVDKDVAQGMLLLGEAAVSGDPGQAQQDTAQAQAAFTDAATAIGSGQFVQPMVGFIDPAKGTFTVWDNQWRVDVGKHLTNGLSLLQQRQTTAGMAELASAYTELDQNGSAAG
ncbi:MAG TPA: hypothetical protein VH352_08995, partial [Pseudonocardiaceae bacterium]|nr:hypothetical protein [Pseudonocardiaceae bacterium]